ncbi:MAG: hypothetical protein QW191_03580, partial [Conexivisphaerales archaeon]
TNKLINNEKKNPHHLWMKANILTSYNTMFRTIKLPYDKFLLETGKQFMKACQMALWKEDIQ